MNNNRNELIELLYSDWDGYQLTEREQIAKEYSEMFHHAIPMYFIPKTIPMEEIIKAAKQCVEEKEDTLLQKLDVHVELKDDIRY